jgi:ribonuclease Z
VPGQKITYVTDTVYTPVNAGKIVDIARGSDYLFIEACFLDLEAEQAAEKRHLTARQAGKLAGEAGAARVTPFHFSPRYLESEHLIREELNREFLTER